MKRIRAFFRVVLIAFVTFFFYTLFLSGRFLLGLAGRDHQSWMNGCTRFWAILVAGILRMRITVIGIPPEPPFLLVSNHLSYLDVVVFFRTLGGTFVVRHDVAGWPVIGRVVKSMRVIFVNREKRRDLLRVNEELASRMDSGRGIIVFPEGTTSSGDTILPFQSPLLSLPAKNGKPVHHAAIRYETGPSDPPAHESVCWWGGVSFAAHVWRLAGTRSIDCRIRFGEQPAQANHRKELARLLQEKVADGYRLLEKNSLSSIRQSNSMTP